MQEIVEGELRKMPPPRASRIMPGLWKGWRQYDRSQLARRSVRNSVSAFGQAIRRNHSTYRVPDLG